MKEKPARSSAGLSPASGSIGEAPTLLPCASIPWKAVAIAAALIMVFAIFIRFADLGKMAYHHDESIHAYYAYKLFANGRAEYKYSPVYHGPLQYHYIALIFLLFGDSDYTGRVAHALCGVAGIALLYLLRRHLPPIIVLLAMLFVAVSPTLSYFSRFARNDILMACFNITTMVCGYLYLKEKRPWQFILAWIAVMLCYSSKESSYVAHGIFGIFMVLYGLWLIAFPSPLPGVRVAVTGRSPLRHSLYRIFVEHQILTAMLAIFGFWSAFQFFYAYIPMHSIDYGNMVGDFTMPKVQQEWAKYHQENPFFFEIWWGAFAVVIAASLFLIGLISRMLRNHPEYAPDAEGKDAAEPEPLIVRLINEYYLLPVTVLLMASVYVFLFSTMGSNKAGLHAGLIEYLTYWFGQQNNPRISGSAWYHVWRLVLYEPGMALFAILGTLYFGVRALLAFIFPAAGEGGAASWKNNLPHPLAALAILWTWASILIYSQLHEKVPWLMVHQALPLCLLSAFFIGDVLLRLPWRPARAAVLVVVAIVSIWAARTSFITNLRNSDDPREAIVYTQSTQDVLLVMDEIDRLARETGLRERFRVAIGGGSEGVDWPYWWYLRRYQPQGPSWNVNTPVMITGASNKMAVDKIVEGDGVWKSYRGRLRAWWVPDKILGQPGWFPKFWRYFVYREVWSPQLMGSSDFQAYIRQDPNGIKWYPAAGGVALMPESTPTMAVASTRPESGNLLQTFGAPGSGPGQFKEPRAMEVGPDGLVYVMDSGNGRVQVFNRDGVFQYPIGRARQGAADNEGLESQYGGPCGLGLAPNGDVLVADTWNHRLVRYDSAGGFLGALTLSPATGGGFWGPRDVAVAPNGNIYVADTGNARICVLDAEGRFLRAFGARGSRPGYLIEPVGVAVHGERVFVADTGNKRIQIFDLDGEALESWPVSGWRAPEFIDPNTNETNEMVSAVEPYIAVDASGNVYIPEYNENLIHQYAPDGRSVRQWGQGRGIRHPTGIATDADGLVFVADKGNNRILKFQRME